MSKLNFCPETKSIRQQIFPSDSRRDKEPVKRDRSCISEERPFLNDSYVTNTHTVIEPEVLLELLWKQADANLDSIDRIDDRVVITGAEGYFFITGAEDANLRLEPKIISHLNGDKDRRRGNRVGL